MTDDITEIKLSNCQNIIKNVEPKKIPRRLYLNNLDQKHERVASVVISNDYA